MDSISSRGVTLPVAVGRQLHRNKCAWKALKRTSADGLLFQSAKCRIELKN